MSESEIETRIKQAAAKHKELIQLLSQADHAAPDLVQQERLIKELETQLEQSSKALKEYERRRKKELGEHETYRDSVMRRFMYKAAGKREKFEARAAKEEREYFDVLQHEHREKELNQNLAARLEESYKTREELQKTAALHRDLQAELDRLYGSIFAGPTPGFPSEDERERDADAAFQAYQDARGKAEAEKHAVNLLGQAANSMKQSLVAIEEALSHSRMDMFGGGTMADMMERNALHRAELCMAEARNFVSQAQRMSPFVADLPQAHINHGNLMSDVFFDNIFTDMAFHDEIKASRARVLRVAQAAQESFQASRARLDALLKEQTTKEARLKETRLALQRERQAAFERVTGEAVTNETGESSAPLGNVPSGDPPPYSE